MKYVFVAGMPKSGTTLIARLLDLAPSVAGQHEYIGREPEELRMPFLRLSAYEGRRYAVPYLRRVKRFIEQEFSSEYFSDVGANLQRAVPYLKEVFDPLAVFHLVRDPRTQVPSHYTHRSDQKDRRGSLLPVADSDMDSWLDGDKFTHACMQWADTTRILVEQGTRLVHLEDLVSDYDYCRRELLEPCGLEISEPAWRAHVENRVNATQPRGYRFARAKLRGGNYVPDRLPAFERWPRARREEFLRICGDAMEMAGYASSPLPARR